MDPQHEPQITNEEAKKIVATKTAPKVTEDSIRERIADVVYHHHDTLTICIITMNNDFHVVGVSACASKANFDLKVGERYAYDNAFKQLWALEGYLLRERMSGDVL